MEQTREKIALTYSMEQTEGRITLINMEPTVGGLMLMYMEQFWTNIIDMDYSLLQLNILSSFCIIKNKSQLSPSNRVL